MTQHDYTVTVDASETTSFQCPLPAELETELEQYIDERGRYDQKGIVVTEAVAQYLSEPSIITKMKLLMAAENVPIPSGVADDSPKKKIAQEDADLAPAEQEKVMGLLSQADTINSTITTSNNTDGIISCRVPEWLPAAVNEEIENNKEKTYKSDVVAPALRAYFVEGSPMERLDMLLDMLLGAKDIPQPDKSKFYQKVENKNTRAFDHYYTSDENSLDNYREIFETSADERYDLEEITLDDQSVVIDPQKYDVNDIPNRFNYRRPVIAGIIRYQFAKDDRKNIITYREVANLIDTHIVASEPTIQKDKSQILKQMLVEQYNADPVACAMVNTGVDLHPDDLSHEVLQDPQTDADPIELRFSPTWHPERTIDKQIEYIEEAINTFESKKQDANRSPTDRSTEEQEMAEMRDKFRTLLQELKELRD